jgi:hypothetical protein
MSKRIGERLVEKKILQEEQVQQVMAHSIASGLAFLDAGADLGLFSREKLARALGPSSSADWFDLRPDFLPKSTQTLFTTDEMIKLGVIGLGYKRTYGFFKKDRLNLGMVNPELKGVQDEVKSHLPKDIKNPKIYLIPADRFLETLDKVYGIKRSAVAAMDPAEVNPLLSLFL